jgi:hypothetical protein
VSCLASTPISLLLTCNVVRPCLINNLNLFHAGVPCSNCLFWQYLKSEMHTPLNARSSKPYALLCETLQLARAFLADTASDSHHIIIIHIITVVLRITIESPFIPKKIKLGHLFSDRDAYIF